MIYKGDHINVLCAIHGDQRFVFLFKDHQVLQAIEYARKFWLDNDIELDEHGFLEITKQIREAVR